MRWGKRWPGWAAGSVLVFMAVFSPSIVPTSVASAAPSLTCPFAVGLWYGGWHASYPGGINAEGTEVVTDEVTGTTISGHAEFEGENSLGQHLHEGGPMAGTAGCAGFSFTVDYGQGPVYYEGTFHGHTDSGTLYDPAYDGSGSWSGTFQGPEATTDLASGVAATTATLNGSADPYGNVTTCEFEYGETTSYEARTPCTSSPGSGNGAVSVHASVEHLHPDKIYHFRIVAANTNGQYYGEDLTVKTSSPGPPTVETRPASAVTQTAATVNAKVNPNGAEVTECKFEWGTNTEYKSTPVSCTPSPGSGTSPVAVTGSLSGLAANTTYHFRVWAKDASGTNEGSDETFTTPPNPPTVLPCAATEITQTYATFCATVNPNGAEVTECKFEWGTSTEYKSTPVPCAFLPGSGTSPVTVHGYPMGLTANTTYHFRISAKNASGPSKGSDEAFKTLPNPPTVETKAASALTQTSATVTGMVNPNGAAVTECKVEYSSEAQYELTGEYDQDMPCSRQLGPGFRRKPGPGVRSDPGSRTRHDLLLPVRGGERGRYWSRSERHIQGAAGTARGRTDRLGRMGRTRRHDRDAGGGRDPWQ